VQVAGPELLPPSGLVPELLPVPPPDELLPVPPPEELPPELLLVVSLDPELPPDPEAPELPPEPELPADPPELLEAPLEPPLEVCCPPVEPVSVGEDPQEIVASGRAIRDATTRHVRKCIGSPEDGRGPPQRAHIHDIFCTLCPLCLERLEPARAGAKPSPTTPPCESRWLKLGAAHA
jgi:hypothetical protein